MKKLFIDLGHSLKYPGAYGHKTEVQWSRWIWGYLHHMLDAQVDNAGNKKWEILLVPDKFVTDWSSNRNLINRINWINARSKTWRDYLLSIHGNWAGRDFVRGVTTVYMGGSKVAQSEAYEMSKAYSEVTGVPIWNGGAFDDRDSRFGRVGMVRDTNPLALLIEAGFVTSKEDMDVDARKAAEGIAKYFDCIDF